MKIQKSHLKELIRQSIKELKFKNQAAFDAYDKKHKMRKSTKVTIGDKDTTVGDAEKKTKGKKGDEQTFNVFVNGHDEPMKIKAKDAKSARHQAYQQIQNPNVKVTAEPAGVGGPSHANVPKGAKSSKDIGKTPQPDDFGGDMEKYLDALNKHMKDVESKVSKDKETDKGDKYYQDKYGAPDELPDETGETPGDEEKYYQDRYGAPDELPEGKLKESKMRRFTVKEVRTWMKTLEENRYKKVYNSDARRVSWMVNNIGENLENMPKSMRKKWTKAQYGRERYLAKEFLKSKQQQMTEQRVRKFVRKVINEQLLKEAKRRELEIHVRDKNKVDKILKKLRLKSGKDYDIGVGSSRSFMLDVDVKHLDKVITIFMKNRIDVRG